MAVGGDKVQFEDEMQDAESSNLKIVVGGNKVQLEDDTSITSNAEEKDAEASTSITQEDCSETPTPQAEGAIKSEPTAPPSYSEACQAFLCQAVPKPDGLSGDAGPNSPFCPSELLQIIPPEILDSQQITDIERASKYIQCFTGNNKLKESGNITIYIEEYETHDVQDRSCCCFNFF